MRVIEINDMLYKIADRDYTFIKEEVDKYDNIVPIDA